MSYIYLSIYLSVSTPVCLSVCPSHSSNTPRLGGKKGGKERGLIGWRRDRDAHNFRGCENGTNIADAGQKKSLHDFSNYQIGKAKCQNPWDVP